MSVAVITVNPMSLPYTTDSGNAALAGGQTIETNWEQVTQSDSTAFQSWIYAVASSDQSGTLYAEQSDNGASVGLSDLLATGVDSALGNSARLKVQLSLAWVRIRYVNGSTPQTKFIFTRRFTEG